MNPPGLHRHQCDEARPRCSRCTSTGRACDGYPKDLLPLSVVRWFGASHPSFKKPGELRALHFFRCRVAPALSEPYDSEFWGDFVLRCSAFEGAIRHSIVAISSLYEDFCRKPDGGQLEDNDFALQHYNTAIQLVTQTQEASLVLLVCILFVCIEYIQGNVKVALQHSQHGLNILDNADIPSSEFVEQLKPMFRRLALWVLSSGSKDTAVFRQEFVQMRCCGMGRIDGPPDAFWGLEKIPGCFASVSEARMYQDWIHMRTAQFCSVGYHSRSAHKPPRDAPGGFKILVMQAETLLDIATAWRLAFEAFREQHVCSPEDEPTLHAMSVRAYVLQEFVYTSLTPGQMVYDAQLELMRSITDDCERLSRSLKQSPAANQGRKLWFDAGLIPYIFLVITKCRDLRLRLRALTILRGHSCTRERSWKRDTQYAIGRRVVEIEHDITLDALDQPIGPVDWSAVPPEEKRLPDECVFVQSEEGFDAILQRSLIS